MPEHLRQFLHGRGSKILNIGDFKLHLSSGRISTTIGLDNEIIGMAFHQKLELDWTSVSKVVYNHFGVAT
jgi:hypothetical protein